MMDRVNAIQEMKVFFIPFLISYVSAEFYCKFLCYSWRYKNLCMEKGHSGRKLVIPGITAFITGAECLSAMCRPGVDEPEVPGNIRAFRRKDESCHLAEKMSVRRKRNFISNRFPRELLRNFF